MPYTKNRGQRRNLETSVNKHILGRGKIAGLCSLVVQLEFFPSSSPFDSSQPLSCSSFIDSKSKLCSPPLWLSRVVLIISSIIRQRSGKVPREIPDLVSWSLSPTFHGQICCLQSTQKSLFVDLEPVKPGCITSKTTAPGPVGSASSQEIVSNSALPVALGMEPQATNTEPCLFSLASFLNSRSISNYG